MRKVFIYCGVSGSGKSTIVRERHATATVCSADQLFTKADGSYDFDPARLPEAHAQCLRRFVDAVRWADDEIVVDNTNTTIAELAPYAALALAYGYELQIYTIDCDPRVAHARNVHGVPLAAIEGMAQRLASRELPPWWDHSFIYLDDNGRAASILEQQEENLSR